MTCYPHYWNRTSQHKAPLLRCHNMFSFLSLVDRFFWYVCILTSNLWWTFIFSSSALLHVSLCKKHALHPHLHIFISLLVVSWENSLKISNAMHLTIYHVTIVLDWSSRLTHYCHKFSASLVVILPACLNNSPVIPHPVTHTRSSLIPFTRLSWPSHLQPFPSLVPHYSGPLTCPLPDRLVCYCQTPQRILLLSLICLSTRPLGICLPVWLNRQFWPCLNTSKELYLHLCFRVVLLGSRIFNPYNDTDDWKSAENRNRNSR